MAAPKTHGEAYASNYDGYRDRLDAKLARAKETTRPIHEHVASLKASGLTGEAAWAEALKHVEPARPAS